MSTIKMLLLGLLLSGSAFVFSCKNDDDPQGCNYATETQDELNALEDAAAAWGADSSNPAKCQAYKDAWQAYLNELEDHIECATVNGQQDELQDAIDQNQAALDQFQC